jgi:hypothetical protein
MDLICRAHQVVEDGYEFFSKRQLVTLFSAPNYCGEFDNAGAMMSVDESLLCSFQVFTAPSFSMALTNLLSPDLEAGREEAKVRLWLQRLKQILHTSQMSCYVRFLAQTRLIRLFITGASDGDRIPSASTHAR